MREVPGSSPGKCRFFCSPVDVFDGFGSTATLRVRRCCFNHCLLSIREFIGTDQSLEALEGLASELGHRYRQQVPWPPKVFLHNLCDEGNQYPEMSLHSVSQMMGLHAGKMCSGSLAGDISSMSGINHYR